MTSGFLAIGSFTQRNRIICSCSGWMTICKKKLFRCPLYYYPHVHTILCRRHRIRIPMMSGLRFEPTSRFALKLLLCLKWTDPSNTGRISVFTSSLITGRWGRYVWFPVYFRLARFMNPSCRYSWKIAWYCDRCSVVNCGLARRLNSLFCAIA